MQQCDALLFLGTTRQKCVKIITEKSGKTGELAKDFDRNIVNIFN